MFARIAALSVMALVTQGCFSLNAEIPEEVIRHHLAREEGIDLAAICSYEGMTFSEGAITCMAGRRMICNADGRWAQDGTCD